MDNSITQWQTGNIEREYTFEMHGKSLNPCYIWHCKCYHPSLNTPKKKIIEQIKL